MSEIDGVIFSPSQTEDYLTCPMLRALKRIEGWVPKRAGRKDLAGILGAGFHAAMAEFNGQKSGVVRCVAVGLEAVAERLYELERGGRVIDPADYAMRDALVPRLTRAVTKFLEQNPIPPTWEIVAVEYEIPESGGARLDLVVEDDKTGQLILVDYKLKTTLDARYRDKEYARMRRAWQLYHYAYFYGLASGQDIQRFLVLTTVLEPRFEILPLDRTTVVINPEKLQLWHDFATRVWADMAAESRGERAIRGQTACETVYGPCEFLDACWEFMYDESLMRTRYVQPGGRT